MKGTYKNGLFRSARFYCFIVTLAFVVGLVPIVFNLVVDPYEMDEFVDTGLEKQKISEKAHYPLWKVIHYPENSPNVVILGDSRARSLRDKYWHDLGAQNAYNFAYGGATIYEIYDTFKYVKKNSDLKALVIGIQLRSFNLQFKNGQNRVPEAIRLSQNPLKYYSNWFVSRIGLRLLQKEIKPWLPQLTELGWGITSSAQAESLAKTKVGQIEGLIERKVCDECMLPENYAASVHPSNTLSTPHYFANHLGIWGDLWPRGKIDRKLVGNFKRQVSRNGKADWRSFEFSNKFWRYLMEISAWSKQNKVQLIFVIPPTIVEMQRRIYEFGYGKLNHELRGRLANLGIVVDFDFDSPLTRNVTRFTDAYHFDYKAARLIVGEIVQLANEENGSVALARKRRKDIICPILEKDVSSRIANDNMEVLEGHSCRIWRVLDG